MNIEPRCRPEPLVDAITGFLAHVHVSGLPEIRETVERLVDAAGPGALERLREHLERAGREWTYCPKDALAQRIHHELARRVLRDPPALEGAAHLDRVGSSAVVMFANHLSYADANAIEVTLQFAGYESLANRLAVVAGPKVYSDLRRRFSSLCFGTIKVPQSSGRASAGAVMAPRDIARAAQQSIRAAHDCLAREQALVVFPEGARSRSGHIERFLPGVARYLKDVDAWVLPVGVCGTETLFPMGEASINPAPVTVHIGRPVRSAALVASARGDRRQMMDAIGFAVAAIVPASYRGEYANAAVHPEAARLAAQLFT